MSIFKNRIDAAVQLSLSLVKYQGTDAVVVAIPRGGVPMGMVIADRLGLPLDVILVKKIGHPAHKEYAIGAISLSNSIISDSDEVPDQYIQEETKRIRQMLQARYQKYYANRKPLSLKDKTVIIVDDGIATGRTLQSTIKLIHEQLPSKVVVAIPVASTEGKELMLATPLVHEVVCLHTPTVFRSVGHYYEDFSQVSEEQSVIEL